MLLAPERSGQARASQPEWPNERTASAEAGLECGELLEELAGEAVAEVLEVLAGVRDLGAPLALVDASAARDGAGRASRPVEVQVVARWARRRSACPCRRRVPSSRSTIHASTRELSP